MLFILLSQVQPDVVDVDYGSTKKQRGRLLYSLDYNAALSTVIKPVTKHLCPLLFLVITWYLYNPEPCVPAIFINTYLSSVCLYS